METLFTYFQTRIKASATSFNAILILVALTIISNFNAEANDDYLLGSGDIVKINVFDYPDLSTETRISESGKITFPLIGEVNIAGKSAADAEKIVASQLSSKGFVTQPHVTLIVSQFSSQIISILGYVKSPGNYILDKKVYILEALALAGGVLPEGDDQIVLTRKDGDKPETMEIDSYELFHGNLKQNLQMKAGDILYVNKAKVFYIYGEVQHPGMYKIERNMNIAQAIAAGGGLTPLGSDSDLEVKRKSSDGKFLTKDAELGDKVMSDDVINVGESWF